MTSDSPALCTTCTRRVRGKHGCGMSQMELSVFLTARYELIRQRHRSRERGRR